MSHKDIFHYPFRLFNTSEQSATNDLNAASKTKRKRRHDIRKILLVLAYLIDCSAGFSVFFITTVGNKSMFQERMLVEIGFFTYSIPVPLAHLFSEVRVRDTIIEKGWYPGLKSIFQTPEAIRNENIEFQQLRIRTSAKRSNRSKSALGAVHNKDVLDAVSERNTCVDYDRDDLERQNLNREKSHTISENHDILVESEELLKYNKDDSFAPIVHCHQDSNEDINYTDDVIQYMDESVSDFSEYEQLTFYNEEVITPLGEFEKQLQGSSSSIIPFKDNVSKPNAQSKDTISNNTETNNCKGMILQSPICNDIIKIQAAFPEHSAELLKLLKDENFATFSKNFILLRALKLLCDGATDTLYRKHFVFICVLGGYPMMKCDTISFHDFITPLINAWYHARKINISEGQDYATSFEEKTNDSTNMACNKIQNERKRIIKLMLIDKNNDQQFNKHLNELHDFEQNQEEMNTDGW